MIDYLTFSWLNPMIKRIKKVGRAEVSDLGQLDTKFNSKDNAAVIQKTWNAQVDEAEAKPKKKLSFFKALLRSFKSYYYIMIIATPIQSLAGIVSPLTVQ